MRTRTRMLLWLYLLLAVGLTVRVPVVQRSEEESLSSGPSDEGYWSSTPPGTPWTRAWVWELGQQSDDSLLVLRWQTYLEEQVGLLLAALIAVIQYGKLDWRYGRLDWLWLAPGGFYAVAAIARLLYVPCTWPWYRDRAVTASGTLPVWQISAEHVRYSFIVFEEAVLLVLLVATYVVLFAASETLRSLLRRWVRHGR